MSSPQDRNTMPNKRQKVALNPSDDDIHAELAAALKEEEKLTKELALLQQKMTENSRRTNDARKRTLEARTSIRAAGGAEFDSLLYIGKDSLSHVQRFLDIKSLGRADQVCKLMKTAADLAWKAYETRQVGRHISACEDVRMRVNRLIMASTYAKQAEDQSESHDHQQYIRLNNGHVFVDYCHEHRSMRTRHERPCCFPRALNNGFMKNPGDHELFVRVSSKRSQLRFERSDHGRFIRFEGFVPSNCIRREEREEGKEPTLSINFRDLDLGRWPALQNCLGIGDGRAEEPLKAMKSQSYGMWATFIALRRGRRIRSRASTVRDSLVCACNYFSWTQTDTGIADRIPNLLQYYDKRFHVISEARSPHRVHEHVSGISCRFVRLVMEKSEGGFVGWKIEDGESPEYIFDRALY